MASASTAVSFGLRFSPMCSRPSVRVSHSSVRLAPFNKANSLRLGSSHNISGFGVALLHNPCRISPTSQVHTPLTVVAAKGYKMKTHKASAKRFRVTGRGKIVRRGAGKQHLLYKKNTKRKLRLSKMGSETLPATLSHINPLDEPSPLGLSLRKSPSLLDLIQMKLSQGSSSQSGASNSEAFDFGVKKESHEATVLGTTEKLKASNFLASHLKIGRWEYKSRYEGDLVAKCYYAKHKLVWEILEGGLKSKIEIQWSNIMALKANCPDDGPATLDVVLARRPLFFKETNPQPRKHTLWQATADFTDGEASMHRQHFLQCPQGLLNKHFEKLIQCDSRLNFLSQQPEIVLGSPYFDSGFMTYEQASICGLERSESDNQSALSTFQDVASSSAASSLKIEQASPQIESPSPSSVMDAREIEENTKLTSKPRNWEQMKVPGLHPSMSMSDLVNHIGNHITEQIGPTKTPFVDNGSEYQDMLNEMALYLLSDNQLSAASDEASLMSRVDSLCCLLQKEPAAVQNSVEGPDNKDNVRFKEAVESRDGNTECQIKIHPEATKDVSGSMQPSAMSRKDSFADLLFHLPRIASLPKFLFNISDGDEDRD